MTNEELYKLVVEGKSLAQMIEIAFQKGFNHASKAMCGMGNK
jgi:hypothetical protein